LSPASLFSPSSYAETTLSSFFCTSACIAFSSSSIFLSSSYPFAFSFCASNKSAFSLAISSGSNPSLFLKASFLAADSSFLAINSYAYFSASFACSAF